MKTNKEYDIAVQKRDHPAYFLSNQPLAIKEGSSGELVNICPLR